MRSATDLLLELATWLQSKRLRVVDIFNRADLDRSGDIDLAELTRVLAGIDVTSSWSALERGEVLRYLDKDRNGRLGLRELEAIIQHTSAAAPRVGRRASRQPRDYFGRQRAPAE